MRIALIGYGKMGKTIERLALKEGHHIVLKISKDNIEALTIENLKKADVAIEFSTPHVVIENIRQCFKAGIPVIVGTTAWHQHKETIERECLEQNAAMLSASNFSLGVNLFFALNKKLAALMHDFQQYQISLTEIHHTAKLDAPSGTAISLAEGILDVNSNYKSWENKKDTAAHVIPIESLREPDVPGTHIISFTSENDIIEIKHTAINRDGFAAGALMAAQWILGKKGVFTMDQVLNLKD